MFWLVTRSVQSTSGRIHSQVSIGSRRRSPGRLDPSRPTEPRLCFLRSTGCISMGPPISCAQSLPVMERFGAIRFVNAQYAGRCPVRSSIHGNSAATRAMRNQRVKAFETEAAQGCAATENGAVRLDRGSGDPEVDEAARSAGTLGDRPLIVLTAGQYWKPADPVAAKEIAEFHENWVYQLQPELARLSTNGKQIVVENSDHGIPEQAPEAVVGAIHEVVTEVRNRQNQ